MDLLHPTSGKKTNPASFAKGPRLVSIQPGIRTSVIDSETNTSHLPGRSRAPKGNDRLPTIHFQVRNLRKMLVSGRVCRVSFRVAIFFVTPFWKLATSKEKKQWFETNTAPENRWSEDYFPFGKAHFRGLWLLVLGRANFTPKISIKKRNLNNILEVSDPSTDAVQNAIHQNVWLLLIGWSRDPWSWWRVSSGILRLLNLIIFMNQK